MSAPRKYDQETRIRAVRMYQDRLGEGGISQLKAREEVGELLDVNQSTLRNWIRQQETDGPATTTGNDTEITALRREVTRLRRANEILRTASAFFASAELDRKLGQ